MGVVGSEAIEAVQDGGAPELPAFITAGDYTLARVPGDFPDDLVYLATLPGARELWIKSSNLLAGPWEWVIMRDDGLQDLSSKRFPTRGECTDDLTAYLARALPPDPELVTVEAAPTSHVADDDDEIMGLALDLAIASLRKARSRFGSAGAAAKG